MMCETLYQLSESGEQVDPKYGPNLLGTVIR
jgi:hypothetical protein